MKNNKSNNSRNKSYNKNHDKNFSKAYKNTPLKLTQDVVFKHFFKNNKNLCAHLIKQFLPPLKDRNIKVLNFLDSVTADHPKVKTSLLDMLVQVDNKELINIEVQCFPQAHFTERILFYWAKLFLNQSKTGIEYKNLHPTYSLVFTNHTLFEELKSHYSCFSIQCENEPHTVFSDHFKLVLVELNKFKDRHDIAHLDEKGLWCYLLNWSSELTKKERKDLKRRSGVMKEVVEKLNKAEMKQRLQLLKDFSDKARYDKQAQLEYAKEQGLKAGRQEGLAEGRQEGLAEGRQEGLAEGTQKGRQEGRQEGLAEGRQEGRTERDKEVILNMLKEKADINFISKITGLPVKEIKKLKNGVKLNNGS